MELLTGTLKLLMDVFGAIFNMVIMMTWQPLILFVLTGFLLPTLLPLIQILLDLFIPCTAIIEAFDIVKNINTIFVTIGMSLLILFFSWYIFKSFFGFLGFEYEEAWKVGITAILCGLFIFYSYQFSLGIVGLVFGDIPTLNQGDTVGNIEQRAENDIADKMKQEGISREEAMNKLGIIKIPKKGFFGYLKSNVLNISSNKSIGDTLVTIFKDLVGSFSLPGGPILNAVIWIYLLIKMIFLGFKFAERLFLNMFYIMISPLAFACGVSKATRDYLKGWFKSFLGNMIVQSLQYLCFLLIIYIFNTDNFLWFVKDDFVRGIFGDYFIASEHGGGGALMTSYTLGRAFLVKAGLVYALVKTTDKMEDILKEMGVGVGVSSTGTTPGGLAMDISHGFSSVKQMSSMIGQLGGAGGMGAIARGGAGGGRP